MPRSGVPFPTVLHIFCSTMENSRWQVGILRVSYRWKKDKGLAYERRGPYNNISPLQTTTMALACDPRLDWQNCSDEWKGQLSSFYYAACIWAAATCTTCIARAIGTYSRRGWPGQPDFLIIPQIISSMAFVAYTFGMAISGGKITSGAAEILWSLPLAIDAYCHVALSLLLRMIQNATPTQLLESKKLYSKARLFGFLLGVIPVAAAGGGAAIAGVRPELGRYSILLATIPAGVLNILFIVLMSSSLYKVKKSSARFPKKAKESIIYCLVYKSLWFLAFIPFLASYTSILSITSIGAWMFLMSWQMLFSNLSMVELCATVAKDQFTLKGMQKLRPKVVVTMNGITSEGATTEVTDAYKSSSSGGDECAGGICRPIHNVDVKVAREMAAPVWKNPPKSWRDLFTFPHPVNEWDARIHAFFATAVGAVILILGAVRPDVCAWYLYAWLIYGFLARMLCGPKFDPQAWFVVLFIVPHLKMKPIFVPGPPKRFAQFCGFAASSASFILYMIPVRIAANWVMGMLVVLTIVQGLHGICVGCFFWHLMVITGIFGEEVEAKSTAEFRMKTPGESATTANSSASRSRSQKPSAHASLYTMSDNEKSESGEGVPVEK
ncbi:glutaredoxin/malate transporter fusion protein [Planoprotostelium fungivorum]|uniref:Glutaredoxin/malate transporter fusion protein n=1 Tax=Planoprotostelium fungivorum TaxID=1890364 RepID=A0A2P6NBB8_9EUKA|nr:glutaredoxin/malate transporter fusion protein [Planoprotostelium fungivorum]